MKRIIKLLLSFILFTIAINGCNLIENCGTCSLVTLENGVETKRTPGVIYCGDDYEDKKNAEPVTIVNTTTYWDCD